MPCPAEAIFQRGLEQRAVAAHAMNAESSRSHVLFTAGDLSKTFWQFAEYCKTEINPPSGSKKMREMGLAETS